MTKDELNRRIAESIEPKPQGYSVMKDGDRPHRSPLDAWSLMWNYITTQMLFCKAIPRDFHVNEYANAMLLEMMPDPLLSKVGSQWECDVNSSGTIMGLSQDRKTAICLAFAKWKGVEVDA